MPTPEASSFENYKALSRNRQLNTCEYLDGSHERFATRYSEKSVRFRFLTSTPLDVRRGSGTFVGMAVVARALEDLGHSVVFETPKHSLPVYTAQRLLFNRSLRPSSDFDVTVGFDMDGYRIASSECHVAALKGVIADEVRFERGLTRLTMSVQARCEWLHVHRAGRVMVTSRYCAGQVRDLYGLEREPVVVPELIDLREWKRLLDQSAVAPSGRFTILSVGRFYRRKRIDVLLRATAMLRERIPGLEVRIVGNGPSAAALHRLAGELRLGSTVTWLGDVSRTQLAAEYTAASVFCLPSVQEGFGIVLLEAMGAGKAIVASRAAAIPEVAPHAELVAPDDPGALAAGLERLWASPDACATQALNGSEWVERFDAPPVAQAFVAACPVTCTEVSR
jgi:glycosyltransferase involved in cell wall biosynthesis